MTTGTRLTIHINPEVYKLRDPRIDRLLSGKMSVEAFTLSITSDDPLILVNDTVYALSESEFYATRPGATVTGISESTFLEILNNPSSNMHETDLQILNTIKGSIAKCSSCRYKKYKDTVLKIALKYGIVKQESDYKFIEYPVFNAPVTPMASFILRNMFHTVTMPRKSCIDCVEKHISQAYILGNETLCGYPEHLGLVAGHLAEALDECPVELSDLHNTLVFSLARTNCYRRPFIPLASLKMLIEVARMSISVDGLDEGLETTHNLESVLDFDDVMCDLVQTLCSKAQIKQLCKMLRAADTQASDRLSWQGTVATAADIVAQQVPEFSAMLRNRRLLFLPDPELAEAEGYNFKNIADKLETK